MSCRCSAWYPRVWHTLNEWMMSEGLLSPQLRGVLEQHIVPLHVGGCRMLRYKLSLTCRELWRRLRDEKFLRYAPIISGYDVHAFNAFNAREKEHFFRFLSPRLCRRLPVGATWFWGYIDAAFRPSCFTKGVAVPTFTGDVALDSTEQKVFKDYGNNRFSLSACRCSDCIPQVLTAHFPHWHVWTVWPDHGRFHLSLETKEPEK